MREEMVSAVVAAKHIISLDKEDTYFTLNEGKTRLNIILHLAQNMYIGKTGKKLIDADFFAYDNGGILMDVQENYAMLLAERTLQLNNVSQEAKSFLKRVFIMLKDAPLAELIEIDHEDQAWQERQLLSSKEDRKMDSLKYYEDYKTRYDAANFYIDKTKEV